ncbi:hypothetical protein [Steroidobacter cummioxidans]|uniref:hypothetical protein n=1 Tax=Steroidobacter cummioxidans TaxID=1803913 RepID=UPI0012908A58|nr:hypothetical protein [Steroidobacter cummioxidans]
MMRKKWVAAAALLAMSAGALADGTYEFDSVTNLTHSGNSITGVLVNDTVPTTLTLPLQSQCFSWMQLMMTNPGAFTLTLTIASSSGGGGPPPPPTLNCQLNAKP